MNHERRISNLKDRIYDLERTLAACLDRAEIVRSVLEQVRCELYELEANS